jgi:cell division protein FtsL
MALTQPKIDERPRIRNPRSARTATQTRIVKTTRARYGGVVRIVAGLSIALVCFMAYLTLFSNATSLTYSLERAKHERDALQEQTARLDDAIAQASSEERLASIAAKLQMHDAQTFAVVQLDAPKVATSKIPVVDAILAWF